MIGGTTSPPLDADEMALRQLDALIVEAREHERQEAARKAEEARREAECKARQPLTLEDLEARRAALLKQIIERETHLKFQEEQEVSRRRAAVLAEQIEQLETQLQALRTERETVVAGLGDKP